MKIKIYILLGICLCFSLASRAQYLSNSSFEGIPGIGISPPAWYPIDPTSTPDTEPLNCDDFQASDGSTYLTLVARGSGSSAPLMAENCQTELIEPLLQGICYTISMDIASRDDLGHYEWGAGFISYTADVRVNVYGSSNFSEKGTLLISTDVPTGTSWQTLHFYDVRPEHPIHYLTLEAVLDEPVAVNGNILVDRLEITDDYQSYVVMNDTFQTSDLPLPIEASEGISYAWSPIDGLSCTDCRSPEISSTVSQTYACDIVSTDNGCPYQELFIINMVESADPPDPSLPDEFKIPNVFTPNGDGINDFFEIQGLPAFSTLQVYDRSGREVHTSDPYENDWDGTDLTGNALPETSYWFILITPGLEGIFKGFVYLKQK